MTQNLIYFQFFKIKVVNLSKAKINFVKPPMSLANFQSFKKTKQRRIRYANQPKLHKLHMLEYAIIFKQRKITMRVTTSG